MPARRTTRYLALSVSDAAEDVIGTIRGGARGYVTKTITGAELVDAIGRVADGDAVFSPRLAGFVLDAFAGSIDVAAVDEDLDRLTEREREVMRLIARGYAYKEVGEGAVHLDQDRGDAHVHGAAQAAAVQPARAHAVGVRPPAPLGVTESRLTGLRAAFRMGVGSAIPDPEVRSTVARHREVTDQPSTTTEPASKTVHHPEPAVLLHARRRLGLRHLRPDRPGRSGRRWRVLDRLRGRRLRGRHHRSAYAELVTKYPQAAGAALYVNKAFGNKALTFLITVSFLSASFAAAGSLATGFSQYFAELWSAPALLVSLAVHRGAVDRELHRHHRVVVINMAMAFVEIVGLLIVMFIGIWYVAEGKADFGVLGEFSTSTATRGWRSSPVSPCRSSR